MPSWNYYGAAFIHRDPRSPKGVWYCAYQIADGRRAFRSTGKRNKAEARTICQAWQQAENEAAEGELTKDRVSEIFSETLRRIGAAPLERIGIKGWLEDWLRRKAWSNSLATRSKFAGCDRQHRLAGSTPVTTLRKGAAQRARATTEVKHAAKRERPRYGYGRHKYHGISGI